MERNDERQRILQMLSKGLISVDEAEQLLSALAGNAGPTTSEPKDRREGVDLAAAASSQAHPPKRSIRYLRILVEPKDGRKGDRVNIKIPISFVRAGAKMTSLLPPGVREKLSGKLQEKGLGFDLGQMTSQNLDSLIDHLGELSIDVDGDGETVKIYCE